MHGNQSGRTQSICGAMLALAAVAMVSACDTMQTKSAPKAMEPIENTIELSATVEKIDLAHRLLQLKAPSGNSMTVQVDPAVQNLPHVQIGDRVVARYRQALGASISAVDAGQPATVDISAQQAEPGEKPGREASVTTNVPVTITAVDTKANLVTFAGQDGLVRAITVQTPQARQFIKQLKPGDTVVVSYTEAFAISVEPAK